MPKYFQTALYNKDRLNVSRETSVFQCFSQLRHNFKQITNQAIICYIENRRVSIFVDGNNYFTVLHTGNVLDSTGNTDSEVQLRRNHLPV